MKHSFVILLSVATILGAGCSSDDGETTLGSGTPGSRTGGAPGDGANIVNLPPGTFKLELDTPVYTSHLLHKAGDFEEECTISPDATGSDRFIECVLEVDELDLMLYGISFSSKMSSINCEHASYVPYVYQAAPAGAGPASVAIIRDTTGAGSVTDVLNSINGEPYCPYDYSHIDEGPNCCTGKYMLTETIITDAGSTTSITESDWGGRVSNCYGGAGTLDSPGGDGRPKITYYANSPLETQGLSISRDYNALNNGVKLVSLSPKGGPLTNDFVYDPLDGHPAVFSNFGYSSIFYANYYNPGLWGGLPDGIVIPYYAFTCYDRAHEETGQILLTVREWNITNGILVEDFTKMDQIGFDTRGMPNNDMGDWDDLYGAITPPSVDPNDYIEGFPYVLIRGL